MWLILVKTILKIRIMARPKNQVSEQESPEQVNELENNDRVSEQESKGLRTESQLNEELRGYLNKIEKIKSELEEISVEYNIANEPAPKFLHVIHAQIQSAYLKIKMFEKDV